MVPMLNPNLPQNLFFPDGEEVGICVPKPTFVLIPNTNLLKYLLFSDQGVTILVCSNAYFGGGIGVSVPHNVLCQPLGGSLHVDVMGFCQSAK